MKLKAVISILFATMFFVSLCGCQLKKPEPETAIAAGDRLIGTVITTESLNTFDIEKYLQENINEVVNSAESGEIMNVESYNGEYQNKIYARQVSITDTTEDGETVEHKEYVFDNIEGFWAFDVKIPPTETEESYTCLCSEGGLSNIHSKIATTDENITSLELTADLYYSYELWGTVFYMNPVYQESDGDVYVVEGFGYSVSGEKGSIGGDVSGSHTISDEVTVNENGEETTVKSSVSVSFIPVYVPQEVSFIFMNDDNEAIDEKTFAPENVPESLDVPEGTQYIIVEQKNEAGSQIDAVGKGVESAEYLAEEKNGICGKGSAEINWK